MPMSVRRLDYDESNMNFGFLLTNMQIVQMPVVHRNTISFQGMAERTHYLCFRKIKQKFYALDKNNQLNCWCAVSGALLSSKPVDH